MIRCTYALIPTQRKRGDTAYTLTRHDPHRYRYAVERAFAYRKQFRRFVIRYDKRADIFFAWFQLGATLIWVENCSHALTNGWRGRGLIVSDIPRPCTSNAFGKIDLGPPLGMIR